MENNNNTYNPDEVFKRPPGKRPAKGMSRGLKIFLIILAVFIVLAVILGLISKGTFGSGYVADLHIDGTISEKSSKDGYNQQWLMETLDQLENDPKNKGILLCINSPGGSVYATAEVYHKLEEYKKKTGRPVATYMGSMAASGGYYIAMASDPIYANENCWTGSIGVIVGTIFDFSGLMEKLGIKGVDVVSGPNKAMGSNLKALTPEQKSIYQSIVDESYNRFVDVVAKGRKMTVDQVKPLADGRIYSATQAKDVNLVDKVVIDQQEAEEDMAKKYKLGDVEFKDFQYEPKRSFMEEVLDMKADKKLGSEYAELFDLMEKNGAFTVTYLSPVRQ